MMNTFHSFPSVLHISDYPDALLDSNPPSETTPPNRLPTGYRDLDRMTGGLGRGDITIFSGSRLNYHYAWLMNVVERMATSTKSQTGGILLFSTQFNGEILTHRMAIRLVDEKNKFPASVESHNDARMETSSVYASMREWPLHIDDSACLSVDELVERTNWLHALIQARNGNGLSLVAIDDLKRVSETSHGTTNLTRSESILGELGKMAKELNVAVLALNQMKAWEQRRNHPKGMHAMKWHRAIERHAGLIAMLDKSSDADATHVDRKGMTPLECTIRKNRNGPIGSFELMLVCKNSRIVDR